MPFNLCRKLHNFQALPKTTQFSSFAEHNFQALQKTTQFSSFAEFKLCRKPIFKLCSIQALQKTTIFKLCGKLPYFQTLQKAAQFSSFVENYTIFKFGRKLHNFQVWQKTTQFSSFAETNTTSLFSQLVGKWILSVHEPSRCLSSLVAFWKTLLQHGRMPPGLMVHLHSCCFV